jgi:hypothetical protein
MQFRLGGFREFSIDCSRELPSVSNLGIEPCIQNIGGGSKQQNSHKVNVLAMKSVTDCDKKFLHAYDGKNIYRGREKERHYSRWNT